MDSGLRVGLDRLVLRRSAASSLARSRVAERAVLRQAEKVRARAASMYGASGYGVRVKQGRTRVRAIVYTADAHAIRSNFKHSTLAKAAKG
ncbi:hypothetical protein HLV35_03095 [Eggerthellaceae bacterium zg-997]|nr:hypothetical protein [Eggerthellaceae bacterium zg-997]